MKLSVTTADDPFRGRKCAACKRTARPGQAVFSRFLEKGKWGDAWLVIHLACLECTEPIEDLISQTASNPVSGPSRQFFVLREQIIRSKEAFPDAAA